MDCRVVVEAAVPVYDVETPDEAVRIAISKTGEMLNPDLNYVEIDMGERSCPHCGEELETAFIAADEGLVALQLEITVFNVEREEHASRIARKEIGQCLENIPLEVLEVEVIEGTDDEAEDETDDESSDDGTGDEAADSVEDDGTATEDAEAPDDAVRDADEEARSPSEGTAEDESGDRDSSDDEVLPEFEDLID